MPEPFKNFFTKARVELLAGHLGRSLPGLDKAAFIRDASGNFEALELKERSNAIRDALVRHLPEEFPAALEVLLAALSTRTDLGGVEFGPDDDGVHGWIVSPMADYVALRGQDHFDMALGGLAEMTKRFSSEFAVRPFLAADPARALGHFARWAQDGNVHVRRLASEGCRPRLPWGMRLHCFVADPAPLLPILEALRDDPEEYVRRSVANNLNDIAKDHPDLVAGIATDWMKEASRDRQRLVRHACRTLVKAGHEGALAVLGFGPALVELAGLEVTTPVVHFGAALEFSAGLRSTAKVAQDIVVDFVIHHIKADGTRSPKVFKLKTARIDAGAVITVRKRHPMKPITTRVYRPGAHRVEIQVNGKVLGGAEFELDMVPQTP